MTEFVPFTSYKKVLLRTETTSNNDPWGKTAFQETKQEQQARNIIPIRNARGDKIERQLDQESFELPFPVGV